MKKVLFLIFTVGLLFVLKGGVSDAVDRASSIIKSPLLKSPSIRSVKGIPSNNPLSNMTELRVVVNSTIPTQVECVVFKGQYSSSTSTLANLSRVASWVYKGGSNSNNIKNFYLANLPTSPDDSGNMPLYVVAARPLEKGAHFKKPTIGFLEPSSGYSPSQFFGGTPFWAYIFDENATYLFWSFSATGKGLYVRFNVTDDPKQEYPGK